MLGWRVTDPELTLRGAVTPGTGDEAESMTSASDSASSDGPRERRDLPAVRLPGTAWRVVLLSAWLLVAVCAVVLVVGLWLPWFWDWSGSGTGSFFSQSEWWAFLIIVLGPGWSLVTVVLAVRDRDEWESATPVRPARVWLSFAAAFVACLIVGRSLLTVNEFNFDGSDFRIGVGGPIATFAAAGLAIAWFTLAVAATVGRGKAAVWRVLCWAGVLPWLASVLVVGLLAAGATVAVPRLAAGWYVDHTTAEPLPSMPVSAPARLDRTKWRVRAHRLFTSTVAGRYLVLGEPRGVRVLDATTGEERWHYWHTLMAAERVVVSADGKAVFLLLYDGGWATGATHMAVGLDVATGRVRWQWDSPQVVSHERRDSRGRDFSTTTQTAAGDVVVLAEVCEINCGYLTAYDVRTGRLRWRWEAGAWERENELEHCVLSQATGDRRQVLVVERCETDPVGGPPVPMFRVRVSALSADSGAVKWSWQQPTPSRRAVPYGMPPRLAVTGDHVMVSHDDMPPEEDGFRPRRVVRLSAEDGTKSWDQPEPRGVAYLLPPVVVDGVAIYPGPTVSIGVNATTGVPRWRHETPQLSGGWDDPEVTAIHGDRVYLLLANGDSRNPGVVRVASITNNGTINVSPDIPLNHAPDSRSEPPRDCVDCPHFASQRLGLGPGILITTQEIPTGAIDVVGIG